MLEYPKQRALPSKEEGKEVLLLRAIGIKALRGFLRHPIDLSPRIHRFRRAKLFPKSVHFMILAQELADVVSRCLPSP